MDKINGIPTRSPPPPPRKLLPKYIGALEQQAGKQLPARPTRMRYDYEGRVSLRSHFPACLKSGRFVMNTYYVGTQMSGPTVSNADGDDF